MAILPRSVRPRQHGPRAILTQGHSSGPGINRNLGLVRNLRLNRVGKTYPSPVRCPALSTLRVPAAASLGMRIRAAACPGARSQ